MQMLENEIIVPLYPIHEQLLKCNTDEWLWSERYMEKVNVFTILLGEFIEMKVIYVLTNEWLFQDNLCWESFTIK